ncbi:Gfo/Idh/MocA family oxidoreductase [Microbacteriaceae bacterium VKM Ac-2854]|nr:Gfo/Idh/MocA family oxidoreductase [Microbacteriaceae bacterium VKM Ac-2854]
MVAGPTARLALIGSGAMAAVHAANIADSARATLVAVAGGRGSADLAARYGARVESLDTVFELPDVDGVVIASPNRFHVEHILAAAAGGKAVLVEKPVDLDLARVDACIASVGSAAARIVVAFNRRFDPSIGSARERAVGGEIGTVTQLTVISRDPTPPALEYLPTSGGIFRDMTIHDFDIVRHFLGEITSVRATTQYTDADIAAVGDPDGAVTVLTARSGAIATIVNARRNAFGYDQRLEAFGPNGSISVGNPLESTVSVAGPGSAGAVGRILTAYRDRYAAAYRAEVEHLVEVILDDVASRSTLLDGRAALALADAATLSAATGDAMTPAP